MDMSCSLDVLVRHDSRGRDAENRGEPMAAVIRQTTAKIDAAFANKGKVAARRKA